MTGEGVDSGVITPPDVMVSPPDVSADSSVEIDAPPVTIDREVPPIIDVSADIAVPPVDVATPVDASITCDPSGPVVSIERVNMQKGEACAGQLAARTFTYAVCTCEDFTAKGLLTGSFDSTVNAVNTQQAGAPVGIAGSFISLSSAIDSVASFGGSVTIAGLPARSALITTPFDVSGDLRIAGPTTFWWRLTTARDLWLLSQVGYLSFVSVLRNYHRGPVGSLRGLTLPIIAGSSTVDGAFTVDDPCGCAQRLDIAAMEAAGSVKNDNALLGIDGASLARVSGTVRLELPCGRFRFDSIGGSGILQLVIHGRTAMFVDAQADLSLIDFQLTLDPGAELDVFVRTNLVLGTKLGDPNHAAAVRVYVGGSADIAIPTAAFGANLYAPNANLSITTQTIAGSVFGKGVTVPEWSHIRYDRAVLSQGNKCGQAATCEKCGCNGGLVCKADGTCGQCAVDEDCCQPLVCSQGTCQPLLPPY